MNGMINSNIENNERGLLLYSIILAANKDDPEAMKAVILHYGSYMTSLSMRKLRDEQGNTYWGIDEDTLVISRHSAKFGLRKLSYQSGGKDTFLKINMYFLR